MRYRRKLLPLAVAAVCAASAWTGASEPLSSQMDAFAVRKTPDGAEQFEPASSVEPGTVVEYRLRLTNEATAAVAGVMANGPIPPHTVYVARTAESESPADLRVSIDGGKTFEPEPVLRTVVGPDGSERRVVIPPERYTHLRWETRGRLDPQAARSFRWRVRVEELGS